MGPARTVAAAVLSAALSVAGDAAAEVLVPCPGPAGGQHPVSVVCEDGRVEVLSPGGTPGEMLSIVTHPDGVREFSRLGQGLDVLGRYPIGADGEPVLGPFETWRDDPEASGLPPPAPGMAFSASVRIETDPGRTRDRELHWSAGSAGVFPIAGCPFEGFQASVRIDGEGSESAYYLCLSDFGLSVPVGLESGGTRRNSVPAPVALTRDLR